MLNSSPGFVKSACAASLERLQTDHIDLYLAHRLDGKVPIEHTVAALAELKAEGKINHLGLSEVSAATLRRAHAVHPIAAVEVEYSPFALDIESPNIGLLHTCRELGVAVLAYSPMGRGMLTGRYTSIDDFEEGDGRKLMPRFSKENFPKNLALVEDLARIAERKGVKPGQLTLAWLMAQNELVFPVPGTSSVRNLEENVKGAEVRLTDEELAEIREVVERAEVHGARYPEGFTDELFRDTPALQA